MNYYAGIDLGGTFVKCGIVDEEGNILCKDKIPTGKDRPYPAIAADMADLVLRLADRVGVSRAELKAIGIGAPGTIDSQNGVIVYSNNISWKNVPLCRELREALSLPVYTRRRQRGGARREFLRSGEEILVHDFGDFGNGSRRWNRDRRKII